MTAAHPVILTVAPNGARRGPSDHHAIPITPEALAAEAVRCLEAGAAMIHLHARDGDGRHTLDVAACQAAIDAVQTATDGQMVVQMTSEAAGIYDRAQQIQAVLAVRPEAVSISIREFFPPGEDPAPAVECIATLHQAGTLIQYILYDPSELATFAALVGSGAILGTSWDLLFVLGRYSGQAAQPADVCGFVQALTAMATSGQVRWSVCAFGVQEAACAMAAIAMGGHARVGFENNLFLAGGAIAPDNAHLVASLRTVVESSGRPLADGGMARQIMSAGRGV